MVGVYRRTVRIVVMETIGAHVGGGPCGGDGVRRNILGLGWAWGRWVRVAVREAGIDTGSQVKIQVNNNCRWCLRM